MAKTAKDGDLLAGGAADGTTTGGDDAALAAKQDEVTVALAAAQAESDRLTAELAAKREALASATAEHEAAIKQLAAVKADIAARHEQLSAINVDVATRQQRLADLETVIGEKQAKLAALGDPTARAGGPAARVAVQPEELPLAAGQTRGQALAAWAAEAPRVLFLGDANGPIGITATSVLRSSLKADGNRAEFTDDVTILLDANALGSPRRVTHAFIGDSREGPVRGVGEMSAFLLSAGQAMRFGPGSLTFEMVG